MAAQTPAGHACTAKPLATKAHEKKAAAAHTDPERVLSSEVAADAVIPRARRERRPDRLDMKPETRTRPTGPLLRPDRTPPTLAPPPPAPPRDVTITPD